MGIQARIVTHDRFDGTGFTNENNLANALLTKPDMINPVITHLMGREDKRFPLTFLTEGQTGGYRTIEVNDVEYYWDVMGRMKQSDRVVSTTYSSSDKPGINHTPFYVVFESNWLKIDHDITSMNGVTARIMERPTPVGSGHYRYTLELVTGTATDYCPISELVAGVSWSMGAAHVSESMSRGNESNVMMPSRIKNQISIIRKSYTYGGNLANKTVEVQFNENGVNTNYWLPFEEWQHMINWKQYCEEQLWYDKYNRSDDGSIKMIDYRSNLPIPYGAGVDDQTPNRDTYGTLTYKKLEDTATNVLYGASDTQNMVIDLFTGFGGVQAFHEAMLKKAGTFTQIMGDKFVKGEEHNLYLTGFFGSFKHVNGYVINLRTTGIFDFGSRAQAARKHPITGLPMTSYDMYFLDRSTYDGAPNLQMVAQKGRGFIRGMEKGMSPVGKADGSDYNGNAYLSTDGDFNSIHFLATKGICVRRNTHCFKLSCSLS